MLYDLWERLEIEENGEQQNGNIFEIFELIRAPPELLTSHAIAT